VITYSRARVNASKVYNPSVSTQRDIVMTVWCGSPAPSASANSVSLRLKTLDAVSVEVKPRRRD
jgi:hypothetical protein